MLGKRKHPIVLCSDGREAVEAADKENFHIVLMDCNMPIMDGWEATETIRAQAGINCKTPIIAVTANAMAGDKEKCLARGMSDYMSKPVNRTSLYAMIDKWAGKAHGAVEFSS
eukprot:CAMPEP_0206233928 /NCGR_PEP_ID=MMETSP0047_2-20121206/12289_1 /ASSEMBLY_ACC=CAM_ASM_000192 /TAXON_ID=195065 /ORGANISM="Chroomonas mesostigmatica_cf, Strain CCMP1168" /LENGTH=112 /DNA_ID=CAMNT_0053657921 /DNA_START=60 /DNA_END=398 /DNA_ORIENTATION=+